MGDSGVDAILEFLKRNKFDRAEAALRNEIGKRPDLNGFMRDLKLNDKDSGSELLEKVNVVGNRGRVSSTSDEVSKEKHVVKEIDRGTGRNGSDSKWEVGSFDGERNNEPIGAKDKKFMFSNGSEDNLLDLYTWRYDPGNGSADPSDNDDNIKIENVKEYQISSQSKIHPSEASDTERINRKVGEETKVSLLGPVTNSKTNLVPNIEPKELNLQRKGNVSKDDFVENPWSRNYEFCSVKTVFPFPEGEASTSYNNNNNNNHNTNNNNSNSNNTTRVSEKEDGKRKTDNIMVAIKEQENEVGRALYFGKPQGNNEPQAFGGSELPRLPPVKLKSTEKLSSLTWDEKHEHDGPGQILNADDAYLIGSFLDVPIDQEISTSGLKRPVGGSWRSISQGITEDTSDLVSGFATIGDGLSGSMDYPHEYWDSDEYDDDDDVGYMRQPIEDETWFLAHEIDYPSDNEKVTTPDPQVRNPNKTDDDDQSFAEEDSYLSGDQHNIAVQYDGDSREEEDETDVADSETSIPTMSSIHGLAERAHKDEEKVADPIEEEDPGALLEDEEVIAVQEQVKQIKAQEEEYETFNLKIVHRKNRTGFEEDKNFHVVLNSVIAGRYHVSEYLGSAAFSKAIQAHDLHTGMDVCVKIIKNNKDFFDQSLDEIKLLKFVNKHDPGDKYHLLRLYDYFYYREHLLIVCELLKANLYEFQKFNRESGGEVYFTMPRLQSITIQCLEALQFLHGLGLIHCDLKPENILVKSYSRCEVKVIDLGSSCFETDHLCSYVQSRSYRAPEVILGLPYEKKIDIWSLGCILAELCTGNVLFQNDSPATLLARVIGIISPIDQDMLAKGRDTHKYFTKNHMLYERNQDTNRLEYLIPKKTSLRHRCPMGDQGFIDFVTHLLEINPKKRPSAAEALKHPWLSYPYEPISS
ncbi:putative dual-specificity kinase CMGC-DYRK-PRP4 family [Helianthus annuus]|nr:putative dual-specificity kinase CMGC-DYRK-PRP4 family [Helianthus annuus]